MGKDLNSRLQDFHMINHRPNTFSIEFRRKVRNQIINQYGLTLQGFYNIYYDYVKQLAPNPPNDYRDYKGGGKE